MSLPSVPVNADYSDGPAEDDVELERAVPTHRLPSESGKSSLLFVLPLLLGLVFLIANIYVITRTPAIFVAKNTTGSTSLLLIVASFVICLVLIGYAVALRRSDDRASARGVGVALLLGLLAPLATVWSLQVNRSFNDRQTPKSCLDVYQQASAIAKDNPRFRMPAKDRDEVRCAINTTLGR